MDTNTDTATDPLAKAPEILAAIEDIRAKGFFDSATFSTFSFAEEGRPHSFAVDVTGYVPNTHGNTRAGIAFLVDMNQVFSTIRETAKTNPVTLITASVKRETWHEYDAENENIIGTKGTRVVIKFSIYFSRE